MRPLLIQHNNNNDNSLYIGKPINVGSLIRGGSQSTLRKTSWSRITIFIIHIGHLIWESILGRSGGRHCVGAAMLLVTTENVSKD